MKDPDNKPFGVHEIRLPVRNQSGVCRHRTRSMIGDTLLRICVVGRGTTVVFSVRYNYFSLKWDEDRETREVHEQMYKITT